jgi:hypothetical protein
MTTNGWVWAVWGAVAGCARFRTCDDVEPLVELPDRLSATGLFADGASGPLADGVEPYAPRWPLWSDGLEKERWALVPSAVDRTNPDDWSFPVGTRLWKAFARNGAAIETRLLAKVGPADRDWVAVAYQWDGDDAYAVPEGVVDASPDGHDIPPAADCFGCHGGTRSRALGVSEVQLAEGPLRDALVGAPPPALPGGAADQAALGYLHANCGHCHHADRPPADGARCYDPENDLDFRLRVGALGRVSDTAVWKTVVGGPIRPGDGDGSEVVDRMSRRTGLFMPPLGTEQVDADGVATVRRWIDGL